jgi:hypothetical protein
VTLAAAGGVVLAHLACATAFSFWATVTPCAFRSSHASIRGDANGVGSRRAAAEPVVESFMADRTVAAPLPIARMTRRYMSDRREALTATRASLFLVSLTNDRDVS